MRVLLACWAIAAVASAVLALQSSAHAQSTPSRVIDRTLRCTIFVQAGLRQIELSAGSWSTGPTAEAQSLGLPSSVYGDLAAVSTHGLSHNRTRCTPARARVPLTSAGLTGGQASPFEDDFDCGASRRVLVRVRAVFEQPVTLRLDWTDSTRRHKHMVATASVRTGAFAIRTEAGRPIAYADVSAASGKARLFTGKGCFLALPLLAAAAVSTQTVTLTVVRAYDEPQSSWKLRFSGSVSSGQAGEDVTVMQQRLATFTVPRGWTLRAFVPAKTAAPCFRANASEKWTS